MQLGLKPLENKLPNKQTKPTKTNDKDRQEIVETTVKALFSEVTLSFHLSDQMTPINSLKKWCDDLVEISRKLRKLLTDLLMLFATNYENGQAIFEMTTEEAE